MLGIITKEKIKNWEEIKRGSKFRVGADVLAMLSWKG